MVSFVFFYFTILWLFLDRTLSDNQLRRLNTVFLGARLMILKIKIRPEAIFRFLPDYTIIIT